MDRQGFITVVPEYRYESMDHDKTLKTVETESLKPFSCFYRPITGALKPNSSKYVYFGEWKKVDQTLIFNENVVSCK
jgi:hypothetical protein